MFIRKSPSVWHGLVCLVGFTRGTSLGPSLVKPTITVREPSSTRPQPGSRRATARACGASDTGGFPIESITKSLSMPWEETLLTLVWDYQADLCVSGPPYFPSASLLLFTSSAMFRVFPTYPSQRSCEVCVCSCNTHHSASCKIEHRRASRSSSEPSKRW